MQMHEVTSSNVAEIGYDPDSLDLMVVFKSGRRYLYNGVPPTEFENLWSAQSVGNYFNKNIRDRYQTTELEPGQQAGSARSSTRKATSIYEELLHSVRPGVICYALFA